MRLFKRMQDRGGIISSYLLTKDGGDWMWKHYAMDHTGAFGEQGLIELRKILPQREWDYTYEIPLSDEELIAMDMMEDGEYALVETIPGLFVVED